MGGLAQLLNQARSAKGALTKAPGSFYARGPGDHHIPHSPDLRAAWLGSVCAHSTVSVSCALKSFFPC